MCCVVLVAMQTSAFGRNCRLPCAMQSHDLLIMLWLHTTGCTQMYYKFAALAALAICTEL